MKLLPQCTCVVCETEIKRLRFRFHPFITYYSFTANLVDRGHSERDKHDFRKRVGKDLQ